MTPMRRYGVDELIAALADLDRAATRRRVVVIIGGAAVALHTRGTSGTKDIDTWESELGDLVTACRHAGIELPPIGSVGVADFPYHFEDRLQAVLHELRFLEVKVPEPHDLALSKVLRWAPGDQDDVRELHEHAPLIAETLIERYLGEMDHVMGNRSEHDWNFRHCIDALFDDVTADEARERLAAHHRRY